MSQYAWPPINPTVCSGDQLAAQLNSEVAALLSGHIGATQPSYGVAGTLAWLQASQSAWLYQFNDGQRWNTLVNYNPTNGLLEFTGNFFADPNCYLAMFGGNPYLTMSPGVSMYFDRSRNVWHLTELNAVTGSGSVDRYTISDSAFSFYSAAIASGSGSVQNPWGTLTGAGWALGNGDYWANHSLGLTYPGANTFQFTNGGNNAMTIYATYPGGASYCLAVTGAGDINSPLWGNLSSPSFPGSVGVAANLNVGGITTLKGLTIASGGNVHFAYGNAPSLVYDGSTSGNLQLVGGVGFQVTGGSVYASGGVYSGYSDGRLKHDMVEVGDGEAILAGLTAYRHGWTAEGQKLVGVTQDVRTLGLIVQDIRKVLPEAVAEMPGTGFDTWDMKPVVSVLVDQVKRLNRRVRQLEGAKAA